MAEKELTERQEAFVVAYISEARYNATEAARIAGYAIPRASGAENLANPEIKRRINEHLDKLRDTGIANKAVRISELQDLYDDLKFIKESRAREAKERHERGEELPESAESGLLVEQTKQVGTGQNAVVTKEWSFDDKLYKSLLSTQDQVAKETGDRDKKIELTGAGGGPLEVASAKSKFFDLIDESES